jgi:hypothetical protein
MDISNSCSLCGLDRTQEFRDLAENSSEKITSMDATECVIIGATKLVAEMKELMRNNAHKGSCVYSYRRPILGENNKVLSLALDQLEEDGFKSETEIIPNEAMPYGSKFRTEEINVKLTWGMV